MLVAVASWDKGIENKTAATPKQKKKLASTLLGSKISNALKCMCFTIPWWAMKKTWLFRVYGGVIPPFCYGVSMETVPWRILWTPPPRSLHGSRMANLPALPVPSADLPADGPRPRPRLHRDRPRVVPGEHLGSTRGLPGDSRSWVCFLYINNIQPWTYKVGPPKKNKLSNGVSVLWPLINGGKSMGKWG